MLTPRGVFSVLTLGLTASGLAFAGAMALIREHSSNLPDLNRIINYDPALYSRVLDRSGAEVFRFGPEKRTLIKYGDIPAIMINAIIAAEDKNFWKHSGYDIMAIARAAVTNSKMGDDERSIGASTITQQTVKNLALTREATLERKIKEAILAAKLERTISKEQIIEIYLNDIYLGNGTYGIVEATRLYFDKEVSELNAAEAAFLAGLPKSPSNYSRNAEEATKRREYVLGRMLADGVITTEEHADALIQPVPIPLTRPRDRVEYVPHFILSAKDEMDSWLGKDAVLHAGVAMHLTRDDSVQASAELALKDGLIKFDRQMSGWRGPLILPEGVNPSSYHIPHPDWSIGTIHSPENGQHYIDSPSGRLIIDKESQAWLARSKQTLATGDIVYYQVGENGTFSLRQVPKIQGGIVAMDPKTGNVLAISGAFDERTAEYNRASQAMRQPGSTLKSFIYAAALQKGWRPNSPVLDSRVSFQNDYRGAAVWRPKDRGNSASGYVTLREGLEKSRNTTTLRLFDDIGFERFDYIMRHYGVYQSVPKEYSVALGAAETTLLALASGYAALAADGRPVKPVFVSSVTDKDGNKTDNPKYDQRLNQRSLFDQVTLTQLRSILNGVTTRGTARSAFRGFGFDTYGKTGTSNSAKDAWYIGFTENILVAAYVGYDQPSPLGGGHGGGSTAAPIVRALMDRLAPEYLQSDYKLPPDISYQIVDPKTGRPAEKGITEILRN